MQTAFRIALDRLQVAMRPEGYWEGRLSSSALSTATALSALGIAGQAEDAPRARAGVTWLAATQNADGGWGDTPDSPSNLSTTLLTTAALALAAPFADSPESRERAETYITERAGRTPDERVEAVRGLYGSDRTFAVPILMNCALAGMVPWAAIPGLPFELAVVPHRFYRALRLHVVSYALPALIAVGLLLDRRNPPRNPGLRALRRAAERSALDRLARIQPEHGGFLDATPLTAFVAMSLIGRYGPEQPVARRALGFLRQSMRPDGSWPIDTDLSVWLTSSAVTALASAGRLSCLDTRKTREWLAARQYRTEHPFTNAAPGGWAWTHRPGGVPDADDTAGAVLALAALGERAPLAAGVRWLRDLQNADGGWPTFCRGWGKLPFDRSSPDITAHALRALKAADPMGSDVAASTASRRAMRYLSAAQRVDGAWVPLWFGSQAAPNGHNPVFGTARVLRALAEREPGGEMAHRGIAYLLGAQHPGGGWGGDRGVAPSIEETAQALAALAAWRGREEVAEAARRGARWLSAGIQAGGLDHPAPIGLYFASLWYSEALYTVLWSVEALGLLMRGPARL